MERLEHLSEGASETVATRQKDAILKILRATSTNQVEPFPVGLEKRNQSLRD
jgi:hypothetical protein